MRLPKDTQYNGNLSGIVGWGDRSSANSKWKVIVAKQNKNAPAVLRLSWGDRGIKGNTLLNDGKWHYIVATSTGLLNEKGLLQAELYVDGKKEQITHQTFQVRKNAPSSKGFDTNTVTKNSQPLMIGSDLMKDVSARTFFKGEIDELTIYDGYMTSKNVKELIHP